jgi:predicted RNase H-like nuclease (RuvC/YqgF family)
MEQLERVTRRDLQIAKLTEANEALLEERQQLSESVEARFRELGMMTRQAETFRAEATAAAELRKENDKLVATIRDLTAALQQARAQEAE